MSILVTNGYVEMMRAEGWQVYARDKGEYCYVTDGAHIAYVQWSDGRPQVSTVHVPNTQTGTGFQFADEITPEVIRLAMDCVAPSWAKDRDRQSVRKYKDWNEFHNSNSFNSELREVTA